MRKAVLAATAAAVALSAPGFAPAAGTPTMAILDASVKFAKAPRDGSVVPGNVLVRGDVALTGTAPDPARDGICLVLGDCAILRRGQTSVPVRGKQTRSGDWRVRAKGVAGKGSGVSLDVNPYSGTFTLKAKRIDVSLLAGDAPGPLTFTFVLGGTTYRSTIPFTPARSDRQWEYGGDAPTFDPPVNPSLPPPPSPAPPTLPSDPGQWEDVPLVDPSIDGNFMDLPPPGAGD